MNGIKAWPHVLEIDRVSEDGDVVMLRHWVAVVNSGDYEVWQLNSPTSKFGDVTAFINDSPMR